MNQFTISENFGISIFKNKLFQLALLFTFFLLNGMLLNAQDCEVDGGVVAGEDFSFCVGDAIDDNVAGITLSGNMGENSQWVVTDLAGNILGLPPMPGAVNFNGAGTGVCLIWHLSYDDGLEGLQMGNHVENLVGCYDLSDDYITVTRNNVNGGNLQALTGNVYNRVVIANRASSSISVINSDNNEIEGTYDMPDDGQPMYAVYNSFNNTVLVGDYFGKVAAFDGKTFAHLGSATAGEGVFHMWLSPDNKQLWVNNELDKTISVIDPNTLTTIATIATPADLLDSGYKPHDVIIMPNNAAAFVTFLGGETDYVVKFSATTFEETDRVAVGADPHVSLTASNPYLYVASQGSSELKILERSDLSEVMTLSIPNAHGLGMNNAGTHLYVGNISEGGANATYTVDLMENVLIGDPVDAPFSAPHNYAVTGDDSKLFLTHSGPNNTVSIYDLSPTPTLVTAVEVGNNPFGLVAYTYVETDKEVSICAGDNNSDAFEVSLEGAEGTNSAWVITDLDLNILALPAAPPFDLDGAGAGTCLIWHLSYENGLEGLAMGANAANFEGCYNLSNAITVYRYEGETNGGILTGEDYSFCVGDGVEDNVSGVSVADVVGSNGQWVVTDLDGNILGLPPTPEAVNFDGAGTGTCLIWHLSYEDGLTGLATEQNVSDLAGCYDLSDNYITVERSQPSGGMVNGSDYTFCVGDGFEDHVSDVTVSDATGSNSQWVVTDMDGNILGLPPTPEAVNFDGAGFGTCLIWHLSYEDGLMGLATEQNVSGLVGCYDLSDNFITVVRSQAEGGTVSGSDYTFCVGDGVADNVSGVTVSDVSGSNSQWVVTDLDGNILGLPPTPEAVNFDGAGTGTCLIWHLSYEDGLMGLATEQNVSGLAGCYDLSDNFITVERSQPSGGTISGSDFSFCVGDGIVDNVSGISISGNSGSNSQWVVTDDQGMILGLPPLPGAVDFDGAGTGTCLIWHLSYEDGLTGLATDNQVSDLVGCYDFSVNFITVVRNEPVEGGVLAGEDFEFCVGDDIADNVSGITLSGNAGANSQWVVTDLDGNILGLPPMPGAVNFDVAGSGTCLIWHLSYGDGLTGLATENNVSDLAGCYDLSDNFITVVRNQADGGTVNGSDYTFCVGDGVEDHVSDVTVSNASGSNSQWVVTDLDGNILGLPPTPEAVNFDGAGTGTCLIWHLSYEDGLMGLATEQNVSGLVGCYDLSDNFITVIRSQAEGGMVNGSDYTFCVGDGVEDHVSDVTVSGASGSNSQWVVTDLDGNILGLPPTPEAVNFDGAGTGTCLIWHLSYEDGLMGLATEQNVSGLVGCYDLSDNYITVERSQPSGGMVNGSDYTFCVDDGVEDHVSGVSVSGASGSNSQWVVTDLDGNILGLPPTPEAVNFDGAGTGTCLIWHLSYEDGLMGLATEQNVSGLAGCYDLSDNFITVTRVSGADCNSNGVDLELSIDVADGFYDQYEEVDYSIVVTNNGDALATGVSVSAALPEGMVFTDADATQGEYELYFEEWYVGELAAGESATLYLTLFTLIENEDIVNFVQVVAQDQEDADSVPDSNNGMTPAEDDEAAVTIRPRDGGGVGNGDGTIDLALSISADQESYDQYENVEYMITLTNDGPDAAHGIIVNAGLPEGMVYTSSNTSEGDYNLYFEQWTIDELAAGASATLYLNLFTLAEGDDIVNFVEVFSAAEGDADSTPGNGNGMTPQEDDEAALTLAYEESSNAPQLQFENLTSKQVGLQGKVYPNPAITHTTLLVKQAIATDARISISDVSGKVQLEKTIQLEQGVNSIDLNIANLTAGNHFIQIITATGESANLRFVKIAN